MRRLEPIITRSLPPNQTAYLPFRRGCEENLLVVKTIAELYEDSIFVLLDYAKAFNTLSNAVIYRALKNQGVSDTLLEATIDSLVKFSVIDHTASDSALFERGVKQGGVTSGHIFCAVMSPLAPVLNGLPLKKPVFIGGLLITFLIFADDIFICSRCIEDADLIGNTVIEWSAQNGLNLNLTKCKILSPINYSKSVFKCVQKAKYLGCWLKYEKPKTLSISRSITNLYYTFKIRDAVRVLHDPSCFRAILNSFNVGSYALHICLSDEIISSRNHSEFLASVSKHDYHWRNLAREFFRTGRDTPLSTNRITAELGLGSARFGNSILKYAADFHRYLLNQPVGNFARAALETGTPLGASLSRATVFYSDYGVPPQKLNKASWTYLPFRERSLVAKILLGVKQELRQKLRSKILQLAGQKKYKELTDLIRNSLK